MKYGCNFKNKKGACDMGSIMADIVIILIVLAVVSGIVVYLYKAKKRGQTCIGCPYAKQCGGNCGSDSNYSSQTGSDTED